MDHMRSLEQCPLTNRPEMEGITKEQVTKLRSRKRQPKMGEAERWREMYKVIFPDENEDLIPSPCESPKTMSILC
jgi:hypothetical protein